MYFEDLDLSDSVLDALYDMRFGEHTPVQEKCIPGVLKGHDALGVAQTGTGKTAAYLLPVLPKPADGGHPESAISCVIMSPTRELAQQIGQGIQGFAYYLNGVSCVAVYGGNDGNRYNQESKSLASGVDVVIATPGRFILHISLGNVDLSKVGFFILDEADRMLGTGFSDGIMIIVKKLPAICQIIMFSATMPTKTEELTKTLLKNPVEIKFAVSKPIEKIQQTAYVCYEARKMGITKDIFKAGDLKHTIIFSGLKQKVKQIVGSFNRMHINCGEMHSDPDQEQRDDVMFKFKSDQTDVLVATDIVSRGIDIDDVAMVINYDVPHDAENYVRCIGCTAHADRDGKAITLVSEDDIYFFQQIESFLEKEVERAQLPAELGEGPEYKSNGKPKKAGNSAKSRRRKGRDHQNHKDRKQGNNKRHNRCPAPQIQNNADGNNANQQERKAGNKRSHRPQKQQDNDPVATEGKPVNKKNSRQNKGKQQGCRPKINNEKRNDRKPANNKSNTENTTNQQNKKPNNKREKRNNRQRTPEDKSARRSTKYDIREGLPSTSNNESSLKALIKKPLKWLRGLGKK